MIDPHDRATIDAFGSLQAESLKRRGRGRPVTATPEDRREQNRQRQARFHKNKKLKTQATAFISDLLTKATKGTNRSNRQTLIEALQYLAGAGENLECEIEFESDITKRVSFDQLPEIIGAGNDTIYLIR